MADSAIPKYEDSKPVNEIPKYEDSLPHPDEQQAQEELPALPIDLQKIQEKYGVSNKNVAAGEAFKRGGLQALTMGHADELQGRAQSLAGLVGESVEKGQLPESGRLEQLYQQYRDASRGEYAKAKEDYPGSYLAGQIGGGVAGSMLIPGAAAAKLGVAGLGATIGGLTAEGESEAPLSSLETAKATAYGTAGGGLIGAAGEKIGKYLDPAFLKEQAKKAATKVANYTGLEAQQLGDRMPAMAETTLEKIITRPGMSEKDIRDAASVLKQSSGKKIGEVYDKLSDKIKATISPEEFTELANERVFGGGLSAETQAAITPEFGKIAKITKEIGKSPSLQNKTEFLNKISPVEGTAEDVSGLIGTPELPPTPIDPTLGDTTGLMGKYIPEPVPEPVGTFKQLLSPSKTTTDINDISGLINQPTQKEMSFKQLRQLREKMGDLGYSSKSGLTSEAKVPYAQTERLAKEQLLKSAEQVNEPELLNALKQAETEYAPAVNIERNLTNKINADYAAPRIPPVTKSGAQHSILRKLLPSEADIAYRLNQFSKPNSLLQQFKGVPLVPASELPAKVVSPKKPQASNERPSNNFGAAAKLPDEQIHQLADSAEQNGQKDTADILRSIPSDDPEAKAAKLFQLGQQSAFRKLLNNIEEV